MNRVEKEAVLHCLKSMIDEEVCEECPLYGTTGTDHCEKDCVRLAINALEQEPCQDVCEWFEQYVDIATDIVELRFSDGTVKRAKRGLYMRDIEKSIRKMLIDKIAQEPKTNTLDKIRAEIQKLRNCSCSCSDGIIDDVEEILDKYTAESEG